MSLTLSNPVSENELIANKIRGRIYCGNFQGGKYISVESYESHTPLATNDVAIINVSEQIELRLSYIEAHGDINGFRLKKIKYNRATKVWETDGEIVLSTFNIKDLAGLSNLLSRISLGDIAQSKVNIDNLAALDEKNLEKQLRAVLATETGRKVLTAISLTQSVSEQDIINVAERKEQLKTFKQLLKNDQYFANKKTEWSCARDEDVWQKFFERNQWIFGYGLNLIACEGFSDEKLEAIVSGSSVLTPGGKRVDALLKTRGFIKSLMFGEIKTHKTRLLSNVPYRPPDTYKVSDDLSGAVSQVQKSIHKTTLRLSDNSHIQVDPSGAPTGEQVALTQPRGIAIVGMLSEFEENNGINFEKFSSFELYRRNINNPEILTFDELYERAKFIVESGENHGAS